MLVGDGWSIRLAVIAEIGSNLLWIAITLVACMTRVLDVGASAVPLL